MKMNTDICNTLGKYENWNKLTLAGRVERLVVPGVWYLQQSFCQPDGKPVETFTLTVRKEAAGRAAVWGMPQGESATVPEQVKTMRAQGKDVFGAVNADFFHFFNNGDKTTYGAQIIDGVVYKEPNDVEHYGVNWFGVTNEGDYVMSDMESYFRQYQGTLRHAVGGGFWLMREGEACVPSSPALEPRTAIAITWDGDLVIVCVDGRSERSVGASYADLLQVFLELDLPIRTVLNLDGGHSTIMMLKNAKGEMDIVNRPSSGLDNLRPIADILTLCME